MPISFFSLYLINKFQGAIIYIWEKKKPQKLQNVIYGKNEHVNVIMQRNKNGNGLI